ncbi:hypothetical protein [Streptomyces sp. WAC06614]|uniref:hypothetical protein n=1 Tax=Streptomyces sp. WAC06614 TaxID=2487416 RepID=UPI000F777422|nr:hypothetical protein [Streptomyces sp. WAC06614]RSS79756.1 hypothetical protein EF918_16180 [Streptomyces sp. WAC06614]
MFEARSVAPSAVGAALLTLVTAAATLLTLMFTTGADESVERSAFFGSLVFETVKRDDGALGITTGVDNPIPLMVLFLVLTAALTWIRTAYRGLKQRREQPLDTSGN